MNSMQFYYFKCKFITGELVELKHCKDGRSVCPICGYISIHPCDAAWEEVEDIGENGIHYCGASFNICSGCNTQYGLDDVDMNIDGKTLTTKEAWLLIRKEWLLGEKSLGKLDKAIEQLKNIDISEDEIKEILESGE